MGIIPDSIYIHSFVLLITFFVLFKMAELLVDGAVGIAYLLNVPKLVIGVILVGFATTAPEFTVSVLSAIRGFPEIALGNAVGSVIVDDALALALGILIAPAAVQVEKRSLRLFGLFLIGIDFLVFGLSLNGILTRLEGALLLLILAGYLVFLFISEKMKSRKRKAAVQAEKKIDPTGAGGALVGEAELQSHVKPGGLGLQFLRFAIGVGGVVIASEFLIDSAVFIASYFGASRAVIGLTVVAIGTSLPEISTCAVAFRKGHGDLGLGDIIGADILNVLWIIGGASLANPITVERRVVFFAFPWMILIVSTMLLLARLGCRLQRWKGFILLALYAIYLSLTIAIFYLP